MKKIVSILFVFAGLLLQTSTKAQDIPLDQFDKAGIEVLNGFIKAIMDNQGDEMAAAKAALPFVHKSDYDASGTNLLRDRLDFSFKKAWQNAKFYKNPILVTRVQKQSLSAIGFKTTAQSGTSYKVWIAKNDGIAGLPAPLHIFFPADGSAPKLHNYGSL